jgi:hypothetical protein
MWHKKWLVTLFLLFPALPLCARGAYAQLTSLQNQIPTTFGPKPIAMEGENLMQQFELGPTKDYLIVKEDGVYYFIAAGQMGSLRKNVTGTLDLWFVKNGVGIPDSNCQESVDKTKSTSIVISQFVTRLAAGDTIAAHFSTSRPQLGLVSITPEGEPVIPSFFFTIFKMQAERGGSK